MKTTAVEIYATHKNLLEKELKLFVDSYKGDNKNIVALSKKIEHMCNNIGCPVSVLPMLKSILKGQKRLYHDSHGERNGMGHFKWDRTNVVLSDMELAHIRNFYFSGVAQDMHFEKGNEYHENAVNVLESLNASMSAKLLSKGKYFNEDNEPRNIYEITLTRGNDSYVFTFGQSIVKTELGLSPSVYDVVACIQKYPVGSFDDFCSDFGYDTDSRNAEQTYKSVCAEHEAMSRLFTEDELEALSEIQ